MEENDITPLWIQLLIFTVFGMVLLILLTSLASLFNAILEGSYNTAGGIAGVITGLATIILAMITGIYVYYTRELVDENRRAREQAVVPVFSITFHGDDRGAVGYPTLVNIGNGPGISVNIFIKIGDICTEINSPGVASGEQVVITDNQIMDLRDLSSNLYRDVDEIVILGSCKTVYGKEKKIENSYDMEIVQASAQASQWN